MWSACWQISLRVARKLNFEEPGVKPGRATWFYFWEAEGFSKEDSKRAVVVYKAERGQADLQFRGTRVAALAAAAKGLVDPSMRIVSANKSASVRIAVPVIDFTGSAVDQEGAIVQGLSVCERLREFFVEHRAQLLQKTFG